MRADQGIVLSTYCVVLRNAIFVGGQRIKVRRRRLLRYHGCRLVGRLDLDSMATIDAG